MTALGLVEHWIPDSEDDARCNIFMSDLTASAKVIIILQNQVRIFAQIDLQKCVFFAGWLKTWTLEPIPMPI